MKVDERALVERRLRQLAQRLDVPPAPDVTAAVRRRLAAEPAPGVRRPRSRWVPRLAGVLAVLLLTTAVATAASPVVRAALVDLLRFAGVELRQQPGPTPTGTGSLPGEQRVDLATARRLAAFTVRVPAALGPPDVVLVSEGRPPRVVSLLWRAGPGRPAVPPGPPGSPAPGDVAARLDQFDGTVPVFEKFLGEAGVQRVLVGGQPALWVAGPHEVLYVDRAGTWHTESARLAGNTLIWQLGGVTLRLEGGFTQAEAVAVAESLR